MKKELLSPVGNYDALLQAVHNGADAVYLGGKKFGARAFASNFDEEEMIKAIKYCHLYGVKIYVTVNTIIYESEIDECINYIRFLHQNNVDAVIMQDLGLIKLTREKFPNLEIHASTQMHNHNSEQIKLLENLGIKRVVLARELSLEEIEKINTRMEIECFIHGALCVSYSGQCLFSSLLLDRSGNRGSCAQVCRLPYDLVKNEETIIKNKYIISPKEFNTVNRFNDILNSNIYSLKIEGRMKSPEYVGFITRIYRQLIDSKTQSITEQEEKNLKSLFNREFTNGFMFNSTNKEIINSESSNHQGIHLGNVINITKDKITIKLDEDISQEDGIRFKQSDKGIIVNFLYNQKGLLINSAKKGEIILVENKIDLETKDEVIKTIDYKLKEELSKINYKKLPLTCEVVAKLNNPLTITISDGVNTITKTGSNIVLAINRSTTEDDIVEKITSLGNTPFNISKINITKDENIFIPLSELKKLKHELINELISMRENAVTHSFIENDFKIEHKKKISVTEKNINILIFH